jgi:SAM-dependent methyltransferase
MTRDSVTENTSLELLFCTNVLGLTSLHYGYWTDHEQLTLENLKVAQRRYTDQLVGLVPAEARRVLDVGCGTGDIARLLTTRGHEVTAISPDSAHWESAKDGQPGLKYVNTRFEDLAIDQTFDLILMAESQNYIDTELGFRQCNRYLCKGGHLLVSGIFGRADAPPATLPAFVANTDAGFVSAAQRHGFQLQLCQDITAQVVPTLDFCRATYEQYVQPAIGIAALWLDRRPFLGTLMRLALKKELSSLRQTRGYYVERFDAALFARTCRYITELFVLDKPIS